MLRHFYCLLLLLFLQSWLAAFETNAQTIIPSQLPNLVLWLKADSLVKDINNKVSSWVNAVGGQNFDQATSLKQPLWVPNIWNGKPVLRFDGIDDYLSAGDNYDIGINNRTVFFVGKANSLPYTFYGKTFAGSAPNRFALMNTNDANGDWSFYLDNNSNFYPLYTGISFTGVNIWCDLLDRNAQQIKLFRNGGQTGGTRPGPQSGFDFNSTLRFLIGAYSDVADVDGIRYLNGDVAEMIVFDRALPDNERNQIEQYLFDKYSQKINLGADTLRTSGFCSIQLNAGTGLTNYRWSTTATTSQISVAETGLYWVSATDIFGNATRDTIQVIFDANFNINDTLVCGGSFPSIGPGLVGPYTYQWSPTGVTTPSTVITQGGTYRVTVTTAGCSRIDSFIVTIDSLSFLTTLGSDTSICSGNFIGLQSGAQLVSSYNWSNGLQTATISITATGNYSVTVTDTNQCSFTDSLQVNVSGVAPYVNFNADTVCLGIATGFSDSSFVDSPATIISWQWDFGGGYRDSFVNPSFIFSNYGFQDVTLKVTSDSGCASTITKQVWVIENPVAFFNLISDGCIGNPYSFSNSSTVGEGDSILTYDWLFGDSTVNSGLQSPVHSYTTIGDKSIQLNLITRGGCAATYSDTLTIQSSAISPDTFFLNQPPNGFVGLAGVVEFSWYASANAATYTLQIATDNAFNNVISNTSSLIGLSYAASLIPGNYYWRVLAYNICGSETRTATRYLSAIDLTSFCTVPVWLRADSLVVKDSNNNVSGWANFSSGPGFNQTDSIQQPKWVDSVWNGKPVIRFDGNEDYLSAGDNYDIGIYSRTVFIVGKANRLPYTFYGKTLASSAPNRFGLMNTNDVNGDWSFYLDNNSDFYPLYTGMAATGANIWSDLIDRSSRQVKLFRNSFQVGGTISGPALGFDFNSSLRFLVGAYSDATDVGTIRNLDGDIAEMITYQCALTDNQRNQVEQYLRFKYAPQINLGPDIHIKYGICPLSPLNIGPWFSDIHWSTGDTGPSIVVSESGTYWVTAKDMFGFPTTDTIVIEYPAYSMTVGNTVICLDSSVLISQLISPVSAYKFFWKNVSSPDTLAYTNTFTATAEGEYYSIIADTNGCFLYSDTVFVNVDSFKLFSLLENDTVMCSRSELALYPYPYAFQSYFWQTPFNTSSLATVAVDSSGIYTVRVTDINLCVANDTIAVTRSWYAPVINFTAGNVCDGDSITFLNRTDSVPPDRISLWSWNFGDDSVSTLQNPSHLYITTGVYYVTLFLITDSGCTGIKTDTVKVNPQTEARYTYSPQVICAGTTVSFNSNATPDVPASTRKWIFNNTDSSSTKNPFYTFPNQGTVPLTFIATTLNGCADTVSEIIEVFPELVADFRFDSVCFGSATKFIDISPSFSILTWQWRFGDNTLPDNLQNPTHTYTTAKIYNVKLTVTNSIGCVDTVNKPVNIVAIPNASFTDQNACEGFPYSPLDNSTSPSEPLTKWNWLIDSSAYNYRSPQHFFSVAGTYPVKLTVTTQHGCVDSTLRVVTIDPNPAALFSFSPLYGEAPLAVTFTNLSTNSATYLWNFGDNSPFSDEENPTHTFLQNDTFNITLKAFAETGCEDSSSKTFIVVPTELDLWVNEVKTTSTAQIDGSVLIATTVSITNLGTRLITSAQLYAILGSGGVITEELTDTIIFPGQEMDYEFHAQFLARGHDAISYVCVEAKDVNDGETETRYDNNKQCTTLSGSIQLVGPSPNPGSDHSVLGIILPKAGKVAVAMVDAIGQYVMEETELKLPAGRSDFEIPVHRMSAAEYFIRVTHNDEKFVRKFVLKR